MSQDFRPPRRGWLQKFRSAGWGIAAGIRGQRSFTVHLGMAVLVVASAAVLGMDRADWGLLLLCIATVIGAELFNSALERLARAVTRSEDEDVAVALDIASGAVLVVSLGAAAVGGLVFLHRIWDWLPG
jgi:diacylglycerol kinase